MKFGEKGEGVGGPELPGSTPVCACMPERADPWEGGGPSGSLNEMLLYKIWRRFCMYFCTEKI